MYEQIRVPPRREVLAPSDGAGDVTHSSPCSTPPNPATPKLTLDDPLDDPDFDQISEREDLEEGEACWRGDPLAIRTRAMADDFSEGRLETVVDSPQKENAGTQTQYVSYQITTKVGNRVRNSMYPPRSSHRMPSPTSSPSKSPSSPSAVASQTLSFYGNSSPKNTHNARSRRCRTSTRWSTFEETASARTSLKGGRTRCIASSSA